MIMIFQLSDWFPKPIIWAIIVTFDQIRKNWWRISCAGRKKRFHGVVGKENVTICGGFTRWNQLRIAWKFTKTVILLGLAGYELIITNSAVYISSYPARPRRITVKYIWCNDHYIMSIQIKFTKVQVRKKLLLSAKAHISRQSPFCLFWLTTPWRLLWRELSTLWRCMIT